MAKYVGNASSRHHSPPRVLAGLVVLPDRAAEKQLKVLTGLIPSGPLFFLLPHATPSVFGPEYRHLATFRGAGAVAQNCFG
jgi:hypothetical protein